MQDAIILYENGKAIGGEGHPINASDITFDNTGTDLVSENVGSAIKEVNSKKADASDLTSIFESGTTASQAISAGTYFYLDGTLVRAKTAIASGATFTLNTNYEEVTIGGSISKIAGDNIKYAKFYAELGATAQGGSYAIDTSAWLSQHGGTTLVAFARGHVYGNDNVCYGMVCPVGGNYLGYSADKGNSSVTVIIGVLFYV